MKVTKIISEKSGNKRIPWNKGLTKNDPRVAKNVENSVKTRKEIGYNPWNKGLTKETDDRIKQYSINNSGENNPMYGKHPEAWNKGLTKETDERMTKASDSHKGVVPWNKDKHIPGHPQTDETREKIRQTHLSPEFKQKRHQIMVTNKTLGVHSDTEAEKNYYNYLLQQYDRDDIVKQYFDKDRYPFNCDFYIKSEDKFIEVHGNWTHGGCAFDPKNENCIEKLKIWKEKAETSKYYQNAIYTWTDLDVRKVETAKKNNLNFEVIYYRYR